MKKLYTLITALFAFTFVNAQTVIYDNGPLVNYPGMGDGGADVSSLHDGLNTYGNNVNQSLGYFIADDFTVPSGATWNIDSVVLFTYQTNSGNTSTITDMFVVIFDKNPSDPTATIIAGDSTLNIMSTTEWTGIYRTSSTTLSSVSRPIMRVCGALPVSLTAGTYWIAWSFLGTSTSGPWSPPITFPVVTVTGNALQYVATSGIWQSVIDTATAGSADDAAQGFPFQLISNTSTGITTNTPSELNISFYPNPVENYAFVTIKGTALNLNQNPATFIVTDMTGREVALINNITGDTFEFKRGNLKKGMYIYKISQGDNVLKTGRFSVY
ncbi:MAG: T9SS type A sorting domain-containing protein [Bacteroidetes bacterium]|jgi:hypothetical protein|nr:T9SS type A sorting domain-containing protein [Bacteroidota bacterium]